MRLLNVGWITNLIMLVLLTVTIMIAKGSTNIEIWKIYTFGFIVPYVSVIIANQFRLYSMPDAYYTDGSLWSNFKTRFYWNHGPQLITLWIIFMIYMFSLASGK